MKNNNKKKIEEHNKIILNYISDNNEYKLFRKMIETFQDILIEHNIGDELEFKSKLVQKIKSETLIGKLSNDELASICGNLPMSSFCVIIRHIQNGQKILAIKEHRNVTYGGLMESKKAIEIMIDNKDLLISYLKKELQMVLI